MYHFFNCFFWGFHSFCSTFHYHADCRFAEAQVVKLCVLVCVCSDRVEFTFSTYLNGTELVNAVENLNYKGGSTHTGAGLKFVADNFFNPSSIRDVPKVREGQQGARRVTAVPPIPKMTGSTAHVFSWCLYRLYPLSPPLSCPRLSPCFSIRFPLLVLPCLSLCMFLALPLPPSVLLFLLLSLLLPLPLSLYPFPSDHYTDHRWQVSGQRARASPEATESGSRCHCSG